VRILLNKYLDELKRAWKHYSKRAGRAFEEPQPGHEESWIYKKIRNFPWVSRGGKISFISAAAVTVIFIYAYWVVLYQSFTRGLEYAKFPKFEEVYTLCEYILQVCILPPMIYLIIILFFAHVFAVVFKRVFDYKGYSIRWIAGKYIKSLGDATVIAIICGIVTFAIFVSDDDQKMFFKYSIMALIFPAGCLAVSWIFFDVILGGSMLNSVAKAVTGSYIDPLLVKMQKIFNASPSDVASIRQDFWDNPLLRMGPSSPEYSIVLGQVKLALLLLVVILFMFFWIRDRKRNSTDES
jgi:membrane protein